MLSFCICFFFFFQAEDGIRDWSVTGVQTCALPICEVPGTRVTMRLANDSPRVMKAVFDEFADPAEYTFDKTVVPVRLAQHEGRSEERRVGKECRSRRVRGDEGRERWRRSAWQSGRR